MSQGWIGVRLRIDAAVPVSARRAMPGDDQKEHVDAHLEIRAKLQRRRGHGMACRIRFREMHGTYPRRQSARVIARRSPASAPIWDAIDRVET